MKIIQSTILFFTTIASLTAFAANMSTPVGLWKTYDDDGQASGYVRINEKDGVYTGIIEKGLPSDTEDKYCTDWYDHYK